MQLRELLARPGIAGTLGLLVGVGLISAIAWSKNLASSSGPQDGVVITMIAMIGAMVVASAVLIGYVLVARAGFIYFGLALSAGFVIGFCVIAFGMIRESYRD